MPAESKDSQEERSRRPASEAPAPESASHTEEAALAATSRVLESRSIAAASNAPVRAAAMLSAQRTHGNRAVQRYLSVQRDDDELNLSLLPPRLTLPMGPLTGAVTPGGAELSYERGPLHAGGEYSWGGPLDLNVGYGAPLQPWLMDVNPSLSAGGAAIPGLLRNPLDFNSISAVGGMAGTLGDIAGSGGSRYPWGVGLQGSIGPDEQRIMAGLTLNY